MAQFAPEFGPMSLQEYLALPEGMLTELIEGMVGVTPAPSIFHQRISRKLEAELNQFLVNSGMGEVFYAPTDVVLSDTVVVEPDLLVIRTEHANRIKEAHIVGAPDLICEILSSGSQRHDRLTKFRLYAQNGVNEYWLIDPQAQIVEVWVLPMGGKDYQRDGAYGPGETARSQVLPGFVVELDAIFN